MNISIIYFRQGNNLKALENYERSLSLFEAIGEKMGVAQALNNIGNLFREEKEYEKAMTYFFAA